MPEPFEATFDPFLYPGTWVVRYIPLLKLLLPEFNLTEANFVNVRPDIHCSRRRMAEGWESAGRIWLWHLLTRRDRVRKFLNPPPWPGYPEGLVMLERWREHVSLIEGRVNFDLMTHSWFFSYRKCLCCSACVFHQKVSSVVFIEIGIIFLKLVLQQL